VLSVAKPLEIKEIATLYNGNRPRPIRRLPLIKLPRYKHCSLAWVFRGDDKLGLSRQVS
jgi:hypothetical protein